MRNSQYEKKTVIVVAGYVLIILAGVALLLNRVFYGIDFTDESWYVAEPYIVANGAIPYVNNWTQAPGFTLPLALLFKLYTTITGGTEGIVLYSRMLYVVVSFIVYFTSIFIIVKKTRQFGALIAVFPLLFSFIYSLYALNYNTMGVMYLFIGSVLLFFSGTDGIEREKKAESVISGIIVARSIIASPSVLAAWVGILAILVIWKKRSQLLWFVVGNTVAAVAVIGWCCIQGGVNGFLNGMRVFLTETGYFRIEKFHTFQDDINYIFYYCKPLLYTFIVLAVFKILSFFSGKRWYKMAVIIICMACVLVGIAKGIFLGNDEHLISNNEHLLRSDEYLIKYGWFGAILIAIFTGETDKNKRNILTRFAWISGLYFMVYILTSATSVSGFGDREYWLIIPTVLGYLSWYFVLNVNIVVATTVFSMNLLLGALLLKQNYGYVYRDQSIENLTARVDYGIWKGCYTTPERAENIKLLEQYICSITDEEDDVLFLDQVCFAYLMTKGKACSLTTADPMSYTYHINSPEILYEYFDSVGRMPDKIVYINFGRDAMLSIDSDWKFNEFVNANYELVETYDTNPQITDKSALAPSGTLSFYVKYYKERR